MKKKISFLFFTVLMIILSTQIIWASSETYSYPDFSSDSYSDIIDHNEKVSLCQLPDSLMNDLPTDELLNWVLDYPLLAEIYAYDNEQIGFNAVYEQFNGLQELFTRNDAGEKILEKYENTQIIKNTSENTSSVFSIAYLEILLMQEDILNQFDSDKMSEVFDEVNEKYIDKKQYPTIYGITADTAYKTLEVQDINEAKTMRASGTVYTPKGSAVSVFNYTPELSSAEKNELSAWVKNNYPNASEKSTATRNYNCHSYAWYSQNTNTNKWWMNDPSKYMSDGSYQKQSYAKVGQRIYYGASGNEHSGIVSALGRGGYNSYITSKWGQMPLVYHFYTDCPYWTDNSDISFWS